MSSRPVAREQVPLRDPVFLVGSERSGTTLLRLMLDHHPAIAFDKEADYMVTMVSDAGVLPSPQSISSGSRPSGAWSMRSNRRAPIRSS